MARGAVAGDELVHDAAAHADELVLGALAGQRERGAIHRDAGEIEQGVAGRDFQRRRGAEAGADRHLAVDQQVRPDQPMARSAQHHRDAADVVAPVAPRAGGGIVEIELDGRADAQRLDAQPPVGPRRRRDPGA